MLQLLRQVSRQVLRLSGRTVRLLYRKLWKEPADVRGHVWTLSLWLRVAGALMCLFKAPLAFLLIGAGWLLSKAISMKPRQGTRPIPYRRHR